MATIGNRPREESTRVKILDFIESKRRVTTAHENKKRTLMEGDESKKDQSSCLDNCSIEESVEAIKKAYFNNGKVQIPDFEGEYNTWEAMLHRNLNLCFYGIGDKSKVIDDFAQTRFKDFIQIKVKGSSPGVKLDSILMKLLQVLEPFANIDTCPDIRVRITKLQNSRHHKKTEVLEVLHHLLHSLSLCKYKMLLIFHDIDGKNFRETETHEYLSDLIDKCAEDNVLSVIASFTNCNFPMLFSDTIVQKYNFAFIALHTHYPDAQYLATDEIIFFNKRESKNSEEIRVVYEALTENQKEILKLLAQRISSEPTGQITYEAFYEHCVDEMIISSENQLAESLKEAIGHGVVHEKIGDQGVKLLKMPNAAEALQIFNREGEDEDADL